MWRLKRPQRFSRKLRASSHWPGSSKSNLQNAKFSDSVDEFRESRKAGWILAPKTSSLIVQFRSNSQKSNIKKNDTLLEQEKMVDAFVEPLSHLWKSPIYSKINVQTFSHQSCPDLPQRLWGLSWSDVNFSVKSIIDFSIRCPCLGVFRVKPKLTAMGVFSVKFMQKSRKETNQLFWSIL